MTIEKQCKMRGMGWGHCDAPECTNPKRTRTVTEWIIEDEDATS